MNIYGIKDELISKNTGKKSIEIREFGWNSDKEITKKNLDRLQKQADLEKNDIHYTCYSIYSMIEKDISKIELSGELKLEDNGQDYEEYEEYYTIDEQVIDKFLHHYIGKKIKITIEVGE